MVNTEFDFEINNGSEEGRACLSLGLTTFRSACDFVAALPYARNLHKSEVLCVLHERRGTCSTKHRFLKSLADAHGNGGQLSLHIGIFMMGEENTPRVGSILQQHQLKSIPEAHCYLRYNEEICDLTFAHSTIDFASTLQEEYTADAAHVHQLKEMWHRAFMAKWAMHLEPALTPEQAWAIREQCIAQLSSD